MFSRRRFIEGGVAGSLAGAFAAWEPPAQAAGSSARRSASAPDRPALRSFGSPRASAAHRAPLYAALFDDRFAEAARFGEEVKRLGVPARAVQGDVTDLWYAELHPLWKREARPIAGLTAYAALFCLERLGWDHGMRVVYHGEHAPPESDPRADWPAQIASLIARTESQSGWSGLPPAPRAAQARILQPLHSWVIAPPARAGAPA